MTTKPKILFFQENSTLQPHEELEVIDKLGTIRPLFRNAQYADVWEDCDAVFGAVPATFLRFPVGHPKEGQPVPGVEILGEFEAREKARIEALREAANARLVVADKAPEGEPEAPPKAPKAPKGDSKTPWGAGA
ncbi:hypothetical protein [Caudoviricetes sp.]|nr:hypothetical protein [Caudoviricetes sp.]